MHQSLFTKRSAHLEHLAPLETLAGHEQTLQAKAGDARPSFPALPRSKAGGDGGASCGVKHQVRACP